MKKEIKVANSARIRTGTIRKVIEVDNLMVVLNVPALFYSDEPKEPYLEPATVKLLTQVRRRAKTGDTIWLRKHGMKVYMTASAI